MRTENTLILGKEDLNTSSKDKQIHRISVDDFYPETIKTIQENNFVLFVRYGETIVLKNRFGNEGIVQSFLPGYTS